MRSYADVATGKNIASMAHPHSQSKVKLNTSQTTLAKTRKLERHKHQSPVVATNVITPKAIVRNTETSQFTPNSKFQLQLQNRFIPLQDLGSNPPPEANTVVSKPSELTSSISQRPCKGKQLNDNCELESCPVTSTPQTLQGEDTCHMESKQGKIPLYIISNKMNCVDYVKCSQQNGTQFGYIPLTPLQIYTGEETRNQKVQDIVDLHYKVKASGGPNF